MNKTQAMALLLAGSVAGVAGSFAVRNGAEAAPVYKTVTLELLRTETPEDGGHAFFLRTNRKQEWPDGGQTRAQGFHGRMTGAKIESAEACWKALAEGG